VLSGVFFLLVKSTIDPTSTMTTAVATAPKVPKLLNAGLGLACEVAEDERDATEVGRMMAVVVREGFAVLAAPNVLERRVVLLRLVVLFIKIVDAGKESSTVA